MSCVPSGIEDACASAGELLALLEEERSVLKGFATDELLKLLPQKEYLVRRLFNSISNFEARDRENAGEDANEKVEQLRSTLKSIVRLNELNRAFIAQSLGYWNRLMAVIDIPSYGPEHCKTRASNFTGKGFHLKREV